MFCLLWVIFQVLAAVEGGGASSGSAEALANGAVNNNGAAAGNNGNAGAQNGLPLNGEAIVGRLVQIGGSLFIQPVGNAKGQPPLQQLIPIGGLQQGGAVVLGQAGGANVNAQGQGAQGARGGPATLFALLSQRNAGGDPQGAALAPGQVQLIPLTALGNQQQAGAAGGTVAGRLRFQRSAAALLRRIQFPATKEEPAKEEPAKEEPSEEEEECSGMEVEEKQNETRQRSNIANVP